MKTKEHEFRPLGVFGDVWNLIVEALFFFPSVGNNLSIPKTEIQNYLPSNTPLEALAGDMNAVGVNIVIAEEMKKTMIDQELNKTVVYAPVYKVRSYRKCPELCGL